jgi:flagellar capping protein FliD
MSTQSVSSSSTGATVSSLGASSPLQITGLASGLDTNSIISALIAIDKQPITALQNQSSGLTATNSALSSVQTALQQLSASAKALGSASLFTNTQTATSTNSTLVSATATTGTGAVIGSYQVGVTNLASSAQRTFSFTSPTAADTVTIDGQQVALNANASAQDLVNAVNSNSNLDVWATATDSGTVVFSNRATGDTGTNYIQVSDTSGSLTEQTALAQQGTNAQYTINGVAHSSASDTITNGIAERSYDHDRHGDGQRQPAGSELAEHPDRGAGVRHVLQPGHLADPDPALHATFEDRSDGRHAVRRPGPPRRAQQHAPGDVHARLEPSPIDVEHAEHRRQHWRGQRLRPAVAERDQRRPVAQRRHADAGADD